MDLKSRLAELRRDEGLTLRELRDRIRERTGDAVSIGYLSELERVDSVPSVDVLAKIAVGYGISVGELLRPVDFFDAPDAVRYPKPLTRLVESGELSAEWAATLGRIEFRGRRPQSEDDWMAVYSVLKALIPQSRGEANP